MADSIAPFIHRKIVVLKEDNTVYDAARAMNERGVGSVVIADGQGHMTGLLTDRDLACDVIASQRKPETLVGEVMAKRLVFIDENATVQDAIQLMKEHGIRRVPVVHQAHNHRSQRCIGLVALDDLIVGRMVTLDDVAQIVRSQIFRRQKDLPQWGERELHSDKEAKRFLKDVHSQTGLSEEAAVAFAALVLGLIVRRLHYTGAANLISLLPRSLRSELDDLPAGPDRSITGERILQEVSTRFDIDRADARQRLLGLWEALSRASAEVSGADFADEIPDDIRVLFVSLPEGVGNESTEASSAPQSETRA